MDETMRKQIVAGANVKVIQQIAARDYSWSSETAMREHYDTRHYRRYREQVQPLLARPSDVVVHHISVTVHAADPNPPDPGLLG